MVKLFSKDPDLRVTAPVDVQFTDGVAAVDEDTAEALSRYMPALGISRAEPAPVVEEPAEPVTEQEGTSTEPKAVSRRGGGSK